MSLSAGRQRSSASTRASHRVRARRDPCAARPGCPTPSSAHTSRSTGARLTCAAGADCMDGAPQPCATRCWPPSTRWRTAVRPRTSSTGTGRRRGDFRTPSRSRAARLDRARPDGRRRALHPGRPAARARGADAGRVARAPRPALDTLLVLAPAAVPRPGRPPRRGRRGDRTASPAPTTRPPRSARPPRCDRAVRRRRRASPSTSRPSYLLTIRWEDCVAAIRLVSGGVTLVARQGPSMTVYPHRYVGGDDVMAEVARGCPSIAGPR